VQRGQSALRACLYSPFNQANDENDPYSVGTRKAGRETDPKDSQRKDSQELDNENMDETSGAQARTTATGAPDNGPQSGGVRLDGLATEVFMVGPEALYTATRVASYYRDDPL